MTLGSALRNSKPAVYLRTRFDGKTRRLPCFSRQGAVEGSFLRVLRWFRRTRAMRRLLISLVVIGALIFSGLTVVAGTANADSSCSQTDPSACSLIVNLTLQDEEQPGWSAALGDLQDCVVNSLLDLHSLPDSDYAAILSWDSDEVRAAMYASITADAAILAGSPATSSTPYCSTNGPSGQPADQQALVAWLTNVVQQNNIQSAADAVREYNTWAGSSYYINLPLQSLTADPNGGADYSSSSPAGADYCQYHPPGPFDTTAQYSGRDVQTCFTSSFDSLGVFFPQPTLGQFSIWGEYDANASLYDPSNNWTIVHTALAYTALGLTTAVVPVDAAALPFGNLAKEAGVRALSLAGGEDGIDGCRESIGTKGSCYGSRFGRNSRRYGR
jgi:hypothetical protein